MTGIPNIESYAMPVLSELPDNKVGWKINPIRSVLLIHDMQQYFVRKFPEPLRSSLLKNVTMIRKYCASLKIPTAYTAQPGSMTSKQRGLLLDFWGPGMKLDPADRNVVDELTPQPEDWSLEKWRYSAFHQSNLLELMRAHERDQLIICGVYAHIGVLMTAVDAFTHDIQPFLVADAIADFSKDHHVMALNYAAKCCASIVLANEVIE